MPMRPPWRLGGLSPRVRGNHEAVPRPSQEGGSIPACAGEPRRPSSPPRFPRVYPRVCGGTRSRKTWARSTRGLSPRVRGNHVAGDGRGQAGGSIPACAGEPTSPTTSSKRLRVYPRVCGGTGVITQCPGDAEGLSPRVRGNLHCPDERQRLRGSIPACAGEPARCRGLATASRVYPRVCGGTTRHQWRIDPETGLSPRVRGNPARVGDPVEGAGSIPACAGEPCRG